MRKKPTFRRPALISSQARNVIIIFALFLQLLPLGVLSNPAHAAVDPNDLYIERTYEHAPELQGNKNVYLDWVIWKDPIYWLQNEITQVQCATTLGICQEKGWYSPNVYQKNGTVGIYLLDENLPMTVTLSVTTTSISDPTSSSTVTINHFYRSVTPDFTVSNFNEIATGTQGNIRITAPYESGGYVYKTWFSCFLPSGVPCVINGQFRQESNSWEGAVSLYNFAHGLTYEVQINRHWARITGGVTDGTVGTTVKKFLIQTFKEGTHPRIGNLKSEIGGCSFDITNYDPNFTYFFKRNSSEVQVSASGRVRLSGQAEGEIRDDYPMSKRDGYTEISERDQLFKCEAQTLPMSPISNPILEVNTETITCTIGKYSKAPTSAAFSLFVDGKHISTNFSALGDYLPDWIIPWATSSTITRTATLTSASWAISDDYKGKAITCATLAYSKNAIGLTASAPMTAR